jgi:hypothetical protein
MIFALNSCKFAIKSNFRIIIILLEHGSALHTTMDYLKGINKNKIKLQLFEKRTE